MSKLNWALHGVTPFARIARTRACSMLVIQGSVVTRLRTHADGVAWNAGLPCSGRIVSLRARGATVTATFLLGDRPASSCDGPGRKATAVFRVRDGKIVLWHQVPQPPPSDAPAI